MEIAYTKVENACLDGVAIIGIIVDSLCYHSSLKVFINLYCCPVKLFKQNKIRADTSHEVSALLVIFVLQKIYNHEQR